MAVFLLPLPSTLHAPSQPLWRLTCIDGKQILLHFGFWIWPMATTGRRLGRGGEWYWGIYSHGVFPAGLLPADSPSIETVTPLDDPLHTAFLFFGFWCLLLPSQPWGSPLSLVISLCSAQSFAKSPFMKLSSNCPNLSAPSVSCWEADWENTQIHLYCFLLKVKYIFLLW